MNLFFQTLGSSIPTMQVAQVLEVGLYVYFICSRFGELIILNLSHESPTLFWTYFEHV